MDLFVLSAMGYWVSPMGFVEAYSSEGVTNVIVLSVTRNMTVCRKNNNSITIVDR